MGFFKSASAESYGTDKDWWRIDKLTISSLVSTAYHMLVGWASEWETINGWSLFMHLLSTSILVVLETSQSAFQPHRHVLLLWMSVAKMAAYFSWHVVFKHLFGHLHIWLHNFHLFGLLMLPVCVLEVNYCFTYYHYLPPSFNMNTIAHTEAEMQAHQRNGMLSTAEFQYPTGGHMLPEQCWFESCRPCTGLQGTAQILRVVEQEWN